MIFFQKHGFSLKITIHSKKKLTEITKKLIYLNQKINPKDKEYFFIKNKILNKLKNLKVI